MRYLVGKCTWGSVEWRIVSNTDTGDFEVWENNTSNLCSSLHEASVHVQKRFLTALDLRPYAAGQQIEIPMTDGSKKTMTVLQNNPDAVTLTDNQSGEQMKVPHFMSGGNAAIIPGANNPQNPDGQDQQNQGTGISLMAPGTGTKVSMKEVRRVRMPVKATHPGMTQNTGPDNVGGKGYESRPIELSAVFSPFDKAPVFPKEGPKLEYRPYRCMNCGNEQMIQTNHMGEVTAYCQNCSWKPSFGNPEYRIPYNGRTYRPFEYAGPTERTVLQTRVPVITVWEEQKRLETTGERKVAVITGGPGSYHVKSEEGKNLGGPYNTIEEAKKRLRQVEYFKHKKSHRVVIAEGDVRTPYFCKNDGTYLERDTGRPRKVCPSCGMLYTSQVYPPLSSRDISLRLADLIRSELEPRQITAQPSEPVQPAAPAEQPSPEIPQGANPQQGRVLTRHEIVDRAEQIIRDALYKDMKPGVYEIVEHMQSVYGNSPDELYQGVTFAWQKVQYEEEGDFNQNELEETHNDIPVTPAEMAEAPLYQRV